MVQADHDHLLHPLHHPDAHQQPKIWVAGRGAMISDVEGREYIDGLSGLWCVNVGHGRRELAEAAAADVHARVRSSYAGSSNLPGDRAGRTAQRAGLPSINTFFFTSGGAEASEARSRPRASTGRPGQPDKVKIISRSAATTA